MPTSRRMGYWRTAPCPFPLAMSMLVLLLSSEAVGGAVSTVLFLDPKSAITSAPVLLQSGQDGTSTIYTNNTSAKASVKALNWLNGWDKRVKITANSSDVDEVLTDFPLLIYLSNSSAGENDRDVSFVFDEIGSSWKKMAVTTSDGTSQCYVEVERWNNASEEAWLWVKVPSVNNVLDSELYLYYDGDHADNTNYVGETDSSPAENVWDTNYVGVWHLKENPNGTAPQIEDSTLNDNDGTSNGDMSTSDQVSGKIDGSLDFDNDNDYINVGDVSSDDWTAITVEGWIYHRDTGDDRVVCKSIGTAVVDHVFSLGVINNIVRVRLGTDGAGGGTTSHDSSGFLTTSTWTHVAFSWNSADETLRFYGDSLSRGSASKDGDTVKNSSQVVCIANVNTVDNRYFNGIIDEVRVSNISRSGAWIKASYESGRDDLLDFGSEEENVVDYVDNNTSDIGSPDDIGTHSNFTAQQYDPDSIYDTLTEEDTLGSWGNYSSNLLVNPGAEFGNTTGWTATGPNAASFASGYDCPSGSAGPHAGSYAFYWNNPSSSSDWAYQEIDLSPWLPGIQSGEAHILAKGWLVCSEYHDPPRDIVRMRVLFYDNSSLEISSDTYDTGELGNLTAWTEFGIENYTIPTNAVKVRMWLQTYEAGWDAGNGDDFTTKIRTYRNYELDLEVQWTNVDFSQENEELCIYGGAMGTENLRVDVRNGSNWENLFDNLSSGWNNISIPSYLTSTNFTIRFTGSNETGDTAQDYWNIDATLIHVWTTDAMTFDYVLRANNTITDSWQIRLMQFSSSNIGRLQTCSICFHNSLDETSNQIVIENGSYTQDAGPWYDLEGLETTYIAMTVQANSTGATDIHTFLEIRVPSTTTYCQYRIAFTIT